MISQPKDVLNLARQVCISHARNDLNCWIAKYQSKMNISELTELVRDSCLNATGDFSLGDATETDADNLNENSFLMVNLSFFRIWH